MRTRGRARSIGGTSGHPPDIYEMIANRTIEIAADDYRKALKDLRKNPKNRDAIESKDEVERFFRSQFYRNLTAVDGEYLIERLRKEAADDSKGIS